MALEIKQSLSMVQQLVMTPQLQQAIRLLQLSHQELVEEIQTQMVENPALEIDSEIEGPRLTPAGEVELPDPAKNGEGEDAAAEAMFELPERRVRQDEPDSDPAETARDPISEIDWAKYMDSIRDQVPGAEARVRSEELPSLEANLTRQSTLADYLEWQLRLSQLDEEETRIGLAIIYNLDEHGYLTGISLEELARDLGVEVASVEAVRKRVQQLDPLGVAALNLQECLSIQARVHFPGDEGMLAVIEHHLHNLEKKNYPQIARDLKIPLEEVYQIHRQVTELDPRPGRAFTAEEPRYITPDIYIIKVGDHYEALLNEDGLPKLKISDYYRRALLGDKNRQTKDYIQEKLRSAAWLIRSIHQRQRTIVKVTSSIIKFQNEFLERGINYLKPLILKDVADDIGMHESTISRVTTNKYVHTPQGIFELKFFFNSAISRNYGEDIASESVKNKIKHLIQTEPADKPFSDQKIVELLDKQNINIARRTVAKYREMLGILSSSKRKRMF